MYIALAKYNGQHSMPPVYSRKFQVGVIVLVLTIPHFKPTDAGLSVDVQSGNVVLRLFLPVIQLLVHLRNSL
jgi:hypothetical protein